MADAPRMEPPRRSRQASLVTRLRVAIAALGVAALGLAGVSPPQQAPVTIRVDTSVVVGPMYPFWAWFGHDEPNYTYTPNGLKLLSQLQALSPVPVFVRVHNLLTSGDGTHALKWGSTNVYTEDASGKPVYDWTILDRIVDSYIGRGMKPMLQLGFMPEALSSAPPGMPYRHFWKPGDAYNDIYTGWTYAPKDYRKWEALCYEVTRHVVEKYGRDGGRDVVVRALERAGHPLLERVGRSKRSRRPAGRAEGANAARRVQQALRLHRRRRPPRAADGENRRTGSDRRRPEHAALVPAAHLGRHQLRHREGGHAARPHHLPRQGPSDIRRGSRPHGRGEPAPGHRPTLRRHQGVSDVREDAHRHRRIGSRRMCGVRGAALPAQRLSQRHDVPDVHGTPDRTHVPAGRPSRREPARRRDVGVPLRGPAVLRRLPRPGDQRHRQTRAEHVPHAGPDAR